VVQEFGVGHKNLPNNSDGVPWTSSAEEILKSSFEAKQGGKSRGGSHKAQFGENL
jgi:hypothetical protein